jgi:Kef-type K+ transport system membrane component KefB
MLESLQNWVHSLQLEPLLIVGVMVGVAFYLGKTMKFIRLPSIIGFMIIGVVLGPSVFDLLSEGFQEDLSFLTDLALGFVAVSIGLELSFSSLKNRGPG